MRGLRELITKIVRRPREKTEAKIEYSVVYEFKIEEKALLEHFLKAVIEYVPISKYADDRLWRIAKAKRSILIEMMLEISVELGYANNFDTMGEIGNLKIWKKKDE